MRTRTFPALHENMGPSVAQANAFQRALSHGGQNTKFRNIYDRFSRDAPTDIGIGTHYLHGLVGHAYTGARETIYAVAEHQGIPVLDLTTMAPRALKEIPLREIVQYILDTPPRCAIIVTLDDNEPCHMHKVITWIAKQQLDIRFRRVVFCLSGSVEGLPNDIQSECFPGTTDDKLQMLLYRVPEAFADIQRLRPIATDMTDYAVFEHRIWSHVTKCSTIDDFLATLMFQVHRRTTIDLEKTLDKFPSFEASWRRSFSSDLQKRLRPMPDATCRGLHRVVPAGVSQDDAIKSIQTALPCDLTDPYALTVSSDAVDDQCGSIVVTQRSHHIVVNVQCIIDPAILSEVCRELRTGCREITQELSKNKAEMTDRFELLEKKFESEIAILKELVLAGGRQRESHNCQKRGCKNRVDAQFANGKRRKQCSSCISMANRSRKKGRLS
jgi:hypothetical protein